LSLLSSNIQGLEKVIDIYFCRKCQVNKIVTTLRESSVITDAPTNVDPFIDDDGSDYEEVLEKPENPYDDEYDGWDPNIG